MPTELLPTTFVSNVEIKSLFRAEVGIALTLIERSGEIILPVRTVLHLIHLLSSYHGEGTCDGGVY